LLGVLARCNSLLNEALIKLVAKLELGAALG